MRKMLLTIVAAATVLSGARAQTVGVVLSGGGASGLAHVGVLKALEENSIPIDYIAGTSIGAFVAGLYAAGYSPSQIETIVTSEYFKRISLGEIEDRHIYYFRKPSPNASWISIRLSSDSNFLETSIPTSFINPAALDFELMRLLDGASARCGYDFDSLFVPFRCVASDIENKESVIFRDGNLNMAVRASMTYPLYLKPLTVDGHMLFDGGLYNNFPTDIMRDVFAPEIIIGSNVSSNERPPREDDFISQLRNMVVSKTNYKLEGECCVLIEPKVLYGTFDFDHQQEKIDSGYVSTMRSMEEIKAKVHRRVHAKVVQERRDAFNAGKTQLIFTDFEYEGLNKAQSSYVNLVMKRKKSKTVDMVELEKAYYRLYESDKIARLFPYATLNEQDTTYKLHLAVKKEKDLLVDFGGNFSSRPINTGYIGIGYTSLNNTGASFYANAYFGKLYSSLLGKARIDVPIRFPIYLEPIITINRWNYYKSRATFFEDNNSLFLIQNERFAQLNIAFALSNKSKITASGGVLSLRDDYYQTSLFGQDDVADNTLFIGATSHVSFEKNSLNDKLYPNKGSFLRLSFRYTDGEETYNPGTTSASDITKRSLHNWVDVKAAYDVFYKSEGTIRLGLTFEGVYSTMQPFSNYVASSLRSPAYQPIPESRTLFLESFRAYQYAAVGQKVVFNVYKGVDLHLEGFLFQPYKFGRLVRDDNDADVDGILDENVFVVRENFDRRYVIGTANAVYRSPLGPISLSVNYYYNVPEVSVDNPNFFTFLFHFGYIIFNDRALQ